MIDSPLWAHLRLLRRQILQFLFSVSEMTTFSVSSIRVSKKGRPEGWRTLTDCRIHSVPIPNEYKVSSCNLEDNLQFPWASPFEVLPWASWAQQWELLQLVCETFCQLKPFSLKINGAAKERKDFLEVRSRVWSNVWFGVDSSEIESNLRFLGWIAGRRSSSSLGGDVLGTALQPSTRQAIKNAKIQKTQIYLCLFREKKVKWTRKEWMTVENGSAGCAVLEKSSTGNQFKCQASTSETLQN